MKTRAIFIQLSAAVILLGAGAIIYPFTVAAQADSLKEILNDQGYSVTAHSLPSLPFISSPKYKLSLFDGKNKLLLETTEPQAGKLSSLILTDIDGDNLRDVIVTMEAQNEPEATHFVDIFRFNGKSFTLTEHAKARINGETHEIWLLPAAVDSAS